MKEKTKELGNSNVLFDFYGKRPEMSQLVPLSLQHVLAAIVGVITPSMIIAGVCGLTDAEKTMMIQAALIFTALATFLQLFPLFHKVGAALPVIMGTSFAYVPTLTAIGGEFGIGAIMGAQIIGGIVAIVFAIFVKQIRKLFPDIVTGTVIFYHRSFPVSNRDPLYGRRFRTSGIRRLKELVHCSADFCSGTVPEQLY